MLVGIIWSLGALIRTRLSRRGLSMPLVGKRSQKSAGEPDSQTTTHYLRSSDIKMDGCEAENSSRLQHYVQINPKMYMLALNTNN